MKTEYSNRKMNMNLIQKTRLSLTIWLHFVLSTITSPWLMRFDAALSPRLSNHTVPSQPSRPPSILLPSHRYALVLTRQLKCSRSQIFAQLWWNISIVWRTEHHTLYPGPAATITYYHCRADSAVECILMLDYLSYCYLPYPLLTLYLSLCRPL